MTKRVARLRIQRAAATTPGAILPRGTSAQDIASQADRAAVAGISVRTQGKLDFLAQQRPDLLAAVQSGQMAVDLAYRQARGQDSARLTPLEQIKKIWTAASNDQRREIARWLITAAQADYEART